MLTRIRRSAMFGLHHATVALGISLLPVALFARRQLGINIPVHRLVEKTGAAYEETAE